MTTLNYTAQTPGGHIRVQTTERGLPIALELSPRELSRAPAELARDIVSLCQLAAKRAQVARRRSLAAQGFGAESIRVLNLSTEDELVAAERALFGGMDSTPDTWKSPL